jgi:hypothetical protein
MSLSLSSLSQTLQTLHTFPSELWAMVFSILDLKSWTKVQLVCKDWCAIANWSRRAVQARKESRWRNYNMSDLVAWTQSGNLPPLHYLLSRRPPLVQINELYSIVGVAFNAANEVLVVSSEKQQRRQQRHLAIVIMVKHYCDLHDIVLEGDTNRFFKKFLYFASGRGNLPVLKALFAKLQMLCYCLANTAAQEGRLNTLQWLVEKKNCRPHGQNIFTLACARGHYNTVSYMCLKLDVVPLQRDMELACINDHMAIVMLFVILRVPFEQDVRRKIFAQCVREASLRVIQYLIDVKWITVEDHELEPLFFGINDGEEDDGEDGMDEEEEEDGGDGMNEEEEEEDSGEDDGEDENMDGGDEDMDGGDEDGDDGDGETDDEEDEDDDVTSDQVMDDAYHRGDSDIVFLLQKFFKCLNPSQVTLEI